MRNKIEISLAQLKSNLNVIKDYLPEKTELIAVIKANAYGHGDVAIASYLETECNVRMLAVAGLYEALRLRREGIKKDILVLSYVDPADLRTAFDNKITLSIISPEHAVAMSKAAAQLGITADVHLALNTGMNRIGFDCKTFKQMMTIAGVYKLPNLNFTGIFSHFSSSDDQSKGAEPYTKLQLDRFNKILSYLSERGINPGLRHIANSGAIGKYKNTAFDAVRCGALMYGYNTALDAKLPVKPIMKWEVAISTVRTLEFGDAVSYSRKFVAPDLMKIATLCVGYADGLPRSLSNKGYVIIKGVKCPIVGNICMDQMMVDVSAVTEEIRMGELATIIGPGQTADDLAEEAGTCMHDILASLASRVARIYTK